MNKLVYQVASDKGVLVTFAREINEETIQMILSFEKKLNASNLSGVVETIQGFCTLFVSYDPLEINYVTLINHLKKVEYEVSKDRTNKTIFHSSKIIEIPAVYGGEYGPDLKLVSNLLKISEEEVIKLHSYGDRLVIFNGFTGGTAYFKGDNELFDLPRKKTPVLYCPEGSLVFSDSLATVFRATGGPTGWYSIGRSPLKQWYPHKDPPILIKIGDWIRYRRIDEEEFYKIKEEVDQGKYKLRYF